TLTSDVVSPRADVCRGLARPWQDERQQNRISYHPVRTLLAGGLMLHLRRLVLFAAALATLSTVGLAQRADAPRALTAADYAHAEQFMTYNTTPLLLRAGVRPTWVRGAGDDRFWYVTTTE